MTHPNRFFNPDWGLMAYRVADAIRAEGPLRYGLDGSFWAYADGVWAPADSVVHARIVRTLRDRYRPAHGQAVRDVLRAELDPMEVGPVPGYVNMANGMVRWDAPDDPALLDHHAEYGSTVQLAVAWDLEATCPAFDRFLSEAVAPDDQARVWEILGYLMMSGNPLQRLFLLTGGGGNGKGVLMHVIKSLLGAGNVSSVPLHDFSESQFATAEVFGKLANVCGDIDATFIERTGRLKELAGEDSVKGERKYGQPFYFTFWGKMIFSANALPAAADGSTGWLRRWEVVDFPNEPARPDRGLAARLSAPDELSGIAVRAVYALRGLMARREFVRGVSADAIHRAFAQRNNKLLGWIEDEAYADPSSWYDRGTLLRAFRSWDSAENPSGRAIAAQTFYERLRNVPGIREAKIKGTRGFRGLRLNRDAHLIDATDEPAPYDGGHSQETMF